MSFLLAVLSFLADFFSVGGGLWRIGHLLWPRPRTARDIRKAVASGALARGTAADEIALILVILEDEALYIDLGAGDYESLAGIRKSLFTIRSQLLDLMYYALAARGEDTLETRRALMTLVGKWSRQDAVSLLEGIIRNPNCDPEIQKLARSYLAILNRTPSVPPKPSAPPKPPAPPPKTP